MLVIAAQQIPDDISAARRVQNVPVFVASIIVLGILARALVVEPTLRPEDGISIFISWAMINRSGAS